MTKWRKRGTKFEQLHTATEGATTEGHGNSDTNTVAGFGKEWTRFSYSSGQDDDLSPMYAGYFGWLGGDFVNKAWVVADFGCGSGRWAKQVVPQVKEVWCIDASKEALSVSKKNLSGYKSVHYVEGEIGELDVPDHTFDFGYSLGVLHHVPDTAKGLRDCVRTLKPGAPFLLYLYYAMDNRPVWFRVIWRVTNLARMLISHLPAVVKNLVCDLIAVVIYWPLARAARLGKKAGLDVDNWPLKYYRDRSLYVMRNDALDRFGTALEKRYTKNQMHQLMQECGLENIEFSENEPYWVAIGWKA